MNRKHLRTCASILSAVLWIAVPLDASSARGAQEGGQPPAEQEGASASRDGGSDASPRGAVRHYLEACRDGEYGRAARYLDLGGIPAAEREEQGAQLARRLKAVLDRTAWIDLESLSAASGGHVDDGLVPELERLATIENTATGPVDILLRSTTEVGGRTLWRFSAATVARIPVLYEEFGYGVLGEVLPATFFEVGFFEVQLWQWIGLLLMILVAYFASWILTAVILSALKPFVARSRTDLDDKLLALTAKPVRVLIALALFTAGLFSLRLAEPVENFLVGLQKGLVVIAIAWLFLRIVDMLTGILRARLQRDGKLSAVAALPLGEKTIKVVVLGFALVAMMQNLGFNVTGLIAGLGVGGLALALAAQKTIENLFGGVSLIMDQPVRVGDFCRYGDKIGTVEDIGLRTTKIRTLGRTVVSVPNSEFAYLQLENFAPRDKILFTTTLGLRYDTTPDQMRWVLAEIRKLFLAHEKVEPEPGRVRFTHYGAFSLDLDIFCYVSTGDWAEYLAIQEDLLLRIMDIVNESGTGFAFPTSTTYIARDGGNDKALTSKAEADVQAWRKEGKLPFPDYAGEFKSEVGDTIRYPAQDSAVSTRS